MSKLVDLELVVFVQSFVLNLLQPNDACLRNRLFHQIFYKAKLVIIGINFEELTVLLLIEPIAGEGLVLPHKEALINLLEVLLNALLEALNGYQLIFLNQSQVELFKEVGSIGDVEVLFVVFRDLK